MQKSIGFEDLEAPLSAMISKGYHNSFLIMENFENMKADFRMQKNELIEELEKKLAHFRIETRDTLQ